MNIDKNILMYGPLSPPIHGQSLSFTLISEKLLCKNKYIVNTNYTNKNTLRKVWITLSAIVKCLYFLMTKKIDLVFFSCSRSPGGAIKDLCLINLASVFKVRMINHVQGADFENLLNGQPGIFQKLVESSYNKVHTTIVLTEGMKKPFLRFKSMQLKVLPNFYDPDLDKYNGSIDTKPHKFLRILYLSNLMKTKGVLETLDAFVLLGKKKENIHLNVVGMFIGDDEASSQEIKDIFYKKTQGISNICYHGVLKGEAKSKILYNSDVFILPSYYVSEAFPLSIVEAMRAGCAVITTNFNYLSEVVKPQNGILVPIRDPKAIAKALEDLIDDPGRLGKIQEHNIAEAKGKYSLATSLEALEEIFNEH